MVEVLTHADAMCVTDGKPDKVAIRRRQIVQAAEILAVCGHWAPSEIRKLRQTVLGSPQPPRLPHRHARVLTNMRDREVVAELEKLADVLQTIDEQQFGRWVQLVRFASGQPDPLSREKVIDWQPATSKPKDDETPREPADNPAGRWACVTCGKRFVERETLTMHRLRQHGQRPAAVMA